MKTGFRYLQLGCTMSPTPPFLPSLLDVSHNVLKSITAQISTFLLVLKLIRNKFWNKQLPDPGETFQLPATKPYAQVGSFHYGNFFQEDYYHILNLGLDLTHSNPHFKNFPNFKS